MKIYTSLEKQSLPLSIALGYFDGVHKGHKKVINETVNLKSKGVIPSVFTFNENPKILISGLKCDQLTDNTTKQKIISDLNIEILYTIDFNIIKDLTPNEFVKNILKEILNAKYVVCGFNYHFGKNGIADANTLKNLCSNYNIKTKIINPILYKYEPISSTRIRETIKNKDYFNAKMMI